MPRYSAAEGGRTQTATTLEQTSQPSHQLRLSHCLSARAERTAALQCVGLGAALCLERFHRSSAVRLTCRVVQLRCAVVLAFRWLVASVFGPRRRHRHQSDLWPRLHMHAMSAARFPSVRAYASTNGDHTGMWTAEAALCWIPVACVLTAHMAW